MAERIVRDATGQARVVGSPRLPWIEPIYDPLVIEQRMIDRIRAQVIDPKAFIRLVMTP